MPRLLALCLLLGASVTTLSAQAPAVPSSVLGWTMPQDASGLTFAVLIDKVRSPLQGAKCAPAINGASECEAPIPAMTPGVHTVQVLGILTAGGQTVEGPPNPVPLSVAFLVVVAPENLRVK